MKFRREEQQSIKGGQAKAEEEKGRWGSGRLGFVPEGEGNRNSSTLTLSPATRVLYTRVVFEKSRQLLGSVAVVFLTLSMKNLSFGDK